MGQKLEITHILGRESTVHININKEGQRETDGLFSSQYEQARALVERYCSESWRVKEEYKKEAYENINNIIAFIGDRGTGKTSCMLSFANWLVSNPITDSTGGHTFGFVRFPPIDPSFFSTDYNIIGAFIARIYSEFQKKSEHTTSQEIERSDRQDFYNALTRAQHSFKKLESKKNDNEDDLEQLEQLKCSLQLKKDVFELVEEYMKVTRAKENTKLIVCIDDLDLNTSTAVSMMEWIRKYLIQPNILILMAINLDQMSSLKRLSLYGEYEILMKKETEAKTDVDAMSDNYLAKLVPTANRIRLPEGDKIIKAQYHLDGEGKWYNSPHNLSDTIVGLLFEKTGYTFFNDGEFPSLIVPRNLRKSIHFLSMLLYMKDDILDNRSRFNDYFFHEFCYEHLNAELRHKLDLLSNYSSPKDFNAYILYVLKSAFDECKNLKNDAAISPDDLCIWNILNKKDISSGDINALLTWLSGFSLPLNQKYFLFIIKTVITIKWSGYYNSQFESYKSLIGGSLYNSSFYDASTKNNVPENKTDSLSGLSDAAILFDKMRKLAEGDSEQKRTLEFLMLCSGDIINEIENGQPVQRKVRFDPFSFFYNIIDIKSCYNKFKKHLGKDIINRILEDGQNSLWSQFLKSSYYSNHNACIDNFDTWDDAIRNTGSTPNIDNDQNWKWRDWVCPRNYELCDDFIHYMYEKITSENIFRGDYTLRENLTCFFGAVFSYHIKERLSVPEEVECRDMNFNYIGYVTKLLENMDDPMLAPVTFNEKNTRQSDDSSNNTDPEKSPNQESNIQMKESQRFANKLNSTTAIPRNILENSISVKE